jgi:hypothetical protein
MIPPSRLKIALSIAGLAAIIPSLFVAIGCLVASRRVE